MLIFSIKLPYIDHVFIFLSRAYTIPGLFVPFTKPKFNTIIDIDLAKKVVENNGNDI